MDRQEDDEDRVAAPEPYRRDVRLLGGAALFAFVVGSVLVAIWRTVSDGFRRTPDTLTIDGEDHAIWLNTGSFGSVAHHDLEAGSVSDDIGISDGRPRPRTWRYGDAVRVWIAAVMRAVRRWL